jgi:hypothetical protein
VTPTDESTTESQVNWDGEKVSDGPWLEQSVLKINDTPITNEDLLISTTILIIVIIIVVVICIGVSWWKRKQIAEGARRASTFIVRASQNVRKTIRLKLGQRVEEDND